MKKRTKNHDCTMQDFERKARELTTLLFALSEQRLSALPLTSPLGDALAAAALSAQNSLKAFIKIAKIDE